MSCALHSYMFGVLCDPNNYVVTINKHFIERNGYFLVVPLHVLFKKKKTKKTWGRKPTSNISILALLLLLFVIYKLMHIHKNNHLLMCLPTSFAFVSFSISSTICYDKVDWEKRKTSWFMTIKHKPKRFWSLFIFIFIITGRREKRKK